MKKSGLILIIFCSLLNAKDFWEEFQMIFRTYSNQQELTNQYAEQVFIQKGMLKIYWDNAIKHSKMLHLFFVPDKNSVLRLDENKQYVDSMLKNKEIYEYSEDMSNDLKDALNQIDWLYLFEEKIELRGDYDSQTQIPYDINYKVERSLGNKYDLFFKRRLGCIVVPVEVTLSNLQITEFNPSGKMFSLEDDFPLYFPIAKILSIKQIPKENIGALSYDEALQDLSCSTIDYLYATSSSNLDMQILNLYKQMEEETSKINDEYIKQTYNTMLQTNNDNVFISLRSSPQLADDNEIVKLFIQDYNIIGYSYDPKSESSKIRAEEKHTLQRIFQEEYYKKYKDKLGKVMFFNHSLFDYNILVRDILNDEWCKVDILKTNLCTDEDEKCPKFDKTYNQMYLRYPEKLRIYQGYLRCENLSKGIGFDI